MIYPSYKITGPGTSRTFFWFCFARLKELELPSYHYRDYLGETYQTEDRMPYWPRTPDGEGGVDAENFDTLRVALLETKFLKEEIEEIMSLPVLQGLTFRKDGDYLVFKTELTGRRITEIMYPIFLVRNIFSHYSSYKMFRDAGLSVKEAALLGSQITFCKDYYGNQRPEQVDDDYILALTFLGLAHLLNKAPGYSGKFWGEYKQGYKSGDNYLSIPEDAFDVNDSLTIEDLTDDLYESCHADEAVKILVEAFKEAMEAVNEQT